MTLDAEGTNVDRARWSERSGAALRPPRPAFGCGARVHECTECLALGSTWTRLLVCLTCGWVACSDDSPGGHAQAHYQETDHPVVAALDPEHDLAMVLRAPPDRIDERKTGHDHS